MKAICVGHASFDTTMPMEEYPVENFKYRIGDCIECGGGPASNAAYLLAKWGIETTFVGVVGQDHYGDRIVREFEDVSVNTKYIERTTKDNTSSSYIIANKSNGSRTIITDKIIPIRKLNIDVLDKCDVIVIDGEHPETAEQVLINNPEAISILDAGRVTDDTKRLGKMVTYVACSKEFAEIFSDSTIDTTDIKSIIPIYNTLKEYFKTNIIITLEDKGCFTEVNGEARIIESINVVALDSTGAGDIYHGGLAYFLVKGFPLDEAVRLANITGALSVTKVGSRNSIPDLNEVIKIGGVDEVI